MAGSNTEEIIYTREQSYGKFSSGAVVMQELKAIVRNHLSYNPAYEAMPIGHKAVFDEGLEMVLHKIGRIVNGDLYHEDSWQDIAGYAKLTLQYLNEESFK